MPPAKRACVDEGGPLPNGAPTDEEAGARRRSKGKAPARVAKAERATTRTNCAHNPATAPAAPSSSKPAKDPQAEAEAAKLAVELVAATKLPHVALNSFWRGVDRLTQELAPVPPARPPSPADRAHGGPPTNDNSPAARLDQPPSTWAVGGGSGPSPQRGILSLTAAAAAVAAATDTKPAAPAAPAPAAPPQAEAEHGATGGGAALDAEVAEWAAMLKRAFAPLLDLEKRGTAVSSGEIHGAIERVAGGVGAATATLEACVGLDGTPTICALCRSNLARRSLTGLRSARTRLDELYGRLCASAASAMLLSAPPRGDAAELRSALTASLSLPEYAGYEVLTKVAYNELIGQKRLWVAGEREALLERLCSRDGRTWITRDFFLQHTSRTDGTGEIYVLVHVASRQIHALAAVADFQTPWTAGQFHHMSHSCQEDRMFFFGRRSEIALMPKVAYDMSASFEGETRWTSHFHLPKLLAVDIICAIPGVRGLSLLLLAHIVCLQSTFTAERTHVLFDISGREENTRMVRFTREIGAQRYQTFVDEARSEGFIGVEGDDPSIYWTHKTADGFGGNTGKTAGVYAIDLESGRPILQTHPAVLFDDRVTQADFGRPGRNCSFFSLAPVQTMQRRLTEMVAALKDPPPPRADAAAAEAAAAEAAPAPASAPASAAEPTPAQAQSEAGPSAAAATAAPGATGGVPGAASAEAAPLPAVT